MGKKNKDGWFFNRSIIKELQEPPRVTSFEDNREGIKKKKRESLASLEKQLREKRAECERLERKIEQRIEQRQVRN